MHPTDSGRSIVEVNRGLRATVIIGDIIGAAATAPEFMHSTTAPWVPRGGHCQRKRGPDGVSRFAGGAPRMRFSPPNSRSYATLHSGGARRGLGAAMRTALPEPVADRSTFGRRRPAPMKVRRHTRPERLQTGRLSSRISFSSPNSAAKSPVVSKPSFDHEAEPESDVHVTGTDQGRKQDSGWHTSRIFFGRHLILSICRVFGRDAHPERIPIGANGETSWPPRLSILRTPFARYRSPTRLWQTTSLSSPGWKSRRQMTSVAPAQSPTLQTAYEIFRSGCITLPIASE